MTDEPIRCPLCGHKHTDDNEWFEDLDDLELVGQWREIACGNCARELRVEVRATVRHFQVNVKEQT